jgi:hypothetical protein
MAGLVPAIHALQTIRMVDGFVQILTRHSNTGQDDRCDTIAT